MTTHPPHPAVPGSAPVRPRLVLVHGTRMRAAFWQAYPALLPEVDVVVPELPGHGGRVAEEFTWEGALATLEEAVGSHEQVVLVGHSLGGYLAMAYAARHPHRLAGLGLIGATGVPRGLGAAVYRGFARLVPAVGPRRVSRVTNALMRAAAGDRDVSALTDDGEGYGALPTAWAGVMAECSPALLAEVTCPVLVLNGGLDQMRLHAREFAVAATSSPQVRLVTVPRATHFLPVTHEQECAHELRRLCSR